MNTPQNRDGSEKIRDNDVGQEDTGVNEAKEGYGGLIVRATTGLGAIPVSGARVIISSERGRDNDLEERTLYVLKTDGDGNTEKVSLEALPASLSETPGVNQPFYTYRINVDADGYYSQTYNGVPIFENILSLQNADLIPLPENGYSDRVTREEIYYENEAPTL